MPVTQFWPAKDVQSVIDHVREKWHKSLDGVEIVAVFQDKPTRSKNKANLATVRKISGLTEYLVKRNEFDPDDFELVPPDSRTTDLGFVVVAVWAKAWQELSREQRVALIDHELCHVRMRSDKEGNDIIAIVGHDLEEFKDVVERHGLWHSEVEGFMESASNAVTHVAGPKRKQTGTVAEKANPAARKASKAALAANGVSLSVQ